VAKDEGDSPSSDELKAQADEPVAAEGAVEDLPNQPEFGGNLDFGSEGFGGIPDANEDAAKSDEDEQTGSETAEGAAESEEWDEALSRERAAKAWRIELACLIGVPIIVLLLAGLCAFTFAAPLSAFSTAVYLIALGFIPYGIWKGRETNTFYAAILGCALAAMLTAAFILWSEMADYRFQFKPEKGHVGAPRGF
jgi:hypothetical protein